MNVIHTGLAKPKRELVSTMMRELLIAVCVTDKPEYTTVTLPTTLLPPTSSVQYTGSFASS